MTILLLLSFKNDGEEFRSLFFGQIIFFSGEIMMSDNKKDNFFDNYYGAE